VLYLARRLGHAVIVLVGVSLLSFLLAEAAPGNAFDELRLDPRVSATTLEALTERYGVDRTFPQTYVWWLRSLWRGDMGFSVAYNSPVTELLWPRALNTLVLTAAATTLAWIVAIPLGAWAAHREKAWPDHVTAATTTTLLGIPDLVLCLALLLAAARTELLPTGGMVSAGFTDFDAWGKLVDLALHAVIPVTALTLMALPLLMRHMRASMLDALRSPCMQAGRALGMSERRLRYRYALRLAANPMISLLGLSVSGLLSASFIVETITSWPGLGPLLLSAVLARDSHVVVGVVMCSTVLLLVGNLVADVLLYWADPRIRVSERAIGVG
jgi:peptide/nickel transport system permease protein